VRAALTRVHAVRRTGRHGNANGHFSRLNANAS